MYLQEVSRSVDSPCCLPSMLFPVLVWTCCTGDVATCDLIDERRADNTCPGEMSFTDDGDVLSDTDGLRSVLTDRLTGAASTLLSAAQNTQV